MSDLNRNQRVCPVERAGTLDNRIRRWLQNPRKILHPYLKEGLTVLELGCGPGFFSLDIAEMVGVSGRLIAVDLQAGMLAKVRAKIQGTALEKRITLHQCTQDAIGVTERVDFVFAFYMVHEVPHQATLFQELSSILQPDGQVFIVEPAFHVSKMAFAATLQHAHTAGLRLVASPKMFLGRMALLKKNVP